MPDIPSGTSTTATISVGDSIINTLETVGDHDWFRIQLTAGQEITVALNGVTLEDPYLRIYNSAGQLVYENDDISSGVNRNSLISFKANTTGAYYIDVGSWDDGYTGDYQLAVSNFVTPPVATNDEIADQLVEGYWGGDDHHFNVTQGGTITVSLTGLTAAGANLARSALSLWSDIIGVTFREVTSSAQITFDDNEEGAFANAIYSINGITSSATVNVGTDWLSRYGTGINSYAFQTYVHEIGHALGLGHAGNYNGDARYPYDALHLNDSWATSVMSYFDQDENTYFGSQGFTDAYVVAPMVADIIAMSRLYGLSTSTRIGDTTYGYNSTAGRDIFNSSLYPTLSYTIFDNGGIDTMDYSGSGAMQKIDLNAEAFSNVNGRVGNVSIARGTIIENAIGGSGPDQIIGNAADNMLDGRGGNDNLNGGAGNDALTGGLGIDTLTGGSGADTFRGAAAAMNGDTITDFAAGDRIVFLDANLSTFNFAVNGQTLTFNGGSMTLTGGVSGQLSARAATGGGVELYMKSASTVPGDASNDFNGDGRSDILWRDGSGTLSEWLAQPNGSFAWNSAAAYHTSASWKLVDTGDFNGDGRDDILWRDVGGTFSQWLGQADGSFAWNGAAIYTIPSDWVLAGAGDFNADGRDDILWRDASGNLSQWLGQTDGSFAWNSASIYWVANSNAIVGTGDFNGDGRDDILWRDNSGGFTQWLGQANGSFAPNASATYQIPANWVFEETGDFNGDGRDDILWRDDTSGTLSEWLGQGNGSFAWNPSAVYQIPTHWDLAQVGDFDGDGRDDILWRDSAGTLSEWLGQADGSFAWNPQAVYQVPSSWQLQPDDLI